MSIPNTGPWFCNGFFNSCDIHSLYNASNLSQPGKFYEMDANREHGSVQCFTDSVVCMDWGYNQYSDYLALGLANGIFR